MRAAWTVAWAVSLSGCTLLFDGRALLGDAAAPTVDMAVPEDMAPAADAGVPADMMAACQPITFNGFGDAGAIDCPCGCVLDPFTAAPSAVRWVASGTPTWGVAAANGVLRMVDGNVSNGDATALTSNYQLLGDFDLRLDYVAVAMLGGAHATIEAWGPFNGTVYQPNAISSLTDNGTALRYNLSVDDWMHDLGGAATVGTFRIHRSGSMLCAEVVGVDSACKMVAAPAMHWYVITYESNAACSLCGPVEMRYSNARLVSGRLVPP